MTHPNPALATYSDADLRAELAARASTHAQAAKQGALARKPWYPTKTAWAEAMLAQAEKTVARMQGEFVPMGPKRTRHQKQLEALEADVRTWRRRAEQYRAAGA